MINRRYIPAVAVLVVLCICPLISTGFSDGSEDPVEVTGNTPSEVKQGNTYTCYVYIDSLKDVTSLDVEVRFNTDNLQFVGRTNVASCTMYNDSLTNGCLRYLYLMNGNGSESMATLFYFNYIVKGDAVLGQDFFDIIVNEAYDSNLNPLSIIGSRCTFTIVEPVVSKTCNIYSAGSVVSSFNRSFDLTYHISSTQISSGSFTINYDPDFISVDAVSEGRFMDSKLMDINRSNLGSIMISFTSSEYSGYTDLFTVTFRVIENVDIVTDVALTVNELCDLDLNDVRCNGSETRVTIEYDNSIIDDKPKIYCSGGFDIESNQMDLIVSVDGGSNLGAGDFTLSFDEQIMSYNRYEQFEWFNPDYCIVNTSESSDGILKFSILSLNGITEPTEMIHFTFDIVNIPCSVDRVYVGLTGNNISDRLTNPIVLNVMGGDIFLPPRHVYGNWIIDFESTCTNQGKQHRVCEECGFVEDYILPLVPHSNSICFDSDHHWEECSICGYRSNEMPHTVADDWSSDGIFHWHSCDGCGVRIDKNHHQGGTGSGITCTICGTTYNSQRTGDFNDDGVLNGLDSLLLKKKIAGWSIDIDDSEMDLNGDGVLNGLDSLLLKKKIAGWNVEFSSY